MRCIACWLSLPYRMRYVHSRKSVRRVRATRGSAVGGVVPQITRKSRLPRETQKTTPLHCTALPKEDGRPHAPRTLTTAQPTPRHEANTWPLHFTHTRVWVRRHPLSRAPLPPCIIHTSPWSAEPRARRDIPVAAVHGRCHPAAWRAWALGGHRLPTRPRRLRGTDDLLVLLRRQRHAGRHD